MFNKLSINRNIMYYILVIHLIYKCITFTCTYYYVYIVMTISLQSSRPTLISSEVKALIFEYLYLRYTPIE